MLFGTRYTFRGDRSPDSVKALLATFAERGEAPGTQAHYVAADGRGGFIITEADSLQETYENLLHFQQWLEFETVPILPIEDAMKSIMNVYG